MADARENLLRNLLQKIAVTEKYDNPDIETDAVPTTGANFSSQLFRAKIRAKDKEELNVFAKVAVVGEQLRKEANFDIFGTEEYFYTKLVKAYKQIEDKHKVPEEYRLAVPKFYGFNGDYLEEIIVMQDLSKDGFVTLDRLKSYDWDYASSAIEQLARLHALSLAFEKEYPEDYKEALTGLDRVMWEGSSVMATSLQNTVESVLQTAKDEHKQKLHKFFRETYNPHEFFDSCKPKNRSVIIHGDYRPSNLLHKIDENGQVQIIAVDYQTLYPGRVITDLLYFIFTGSDGAFREKYYDQLIEHYYESLAAALRRLGLEPEDAFPRKYFDQELSEMLPYGLFISTLLLPLITVDQDHMTKDGEAFENNSSGTLTELMKHTNELFVERFNEVVDDYIKWGVL